jgi:hypothetical protein
MYAGPSATGQIEPARGRDRTARGLAGKDVPAELDEEGVVVTLVRVLAVVMRLRGSVGDILFRVDRPDRTHVRLIARGTWRALIDVHIQDAVFEDPGRVRVRLMGVLVTPLPASTSENSALFSGSNS